jgi:Domain of unknown function (DUF4190)/Septum formation
MEPMLPPPPPSGGAPFSRPAPYVPPPLPSAAPGFGWQPATPPTRRPGLAIAAMVCGIVGVFMFWFFGIVPLLGVIFGLVSGRSIKRSNGTLTGLGMARTGWILGLVGLAGGVVFVWAAASGRLDDAGTSADNPTVGSCIDELPAEGELVFSLNVVDCNLTHQGEVFAIEQLNAGKDRKFPGDSATAKQVRDACLSAFTDYVGRPYADSKLDFDYLHPDQLGWKRGGEYTCIVFDPAGDNTGSLADADR